MMHRRKHGQSSPFRAPLAASALLLASVVSSPSVGAAQEGAALGPAAALPRIVVTPAELEPGGSRLVVTNVFALGEFKEKDLNHLNGLLRSTVLGSGGADAPVWELYTVMRSHMMHTTNKSAAAIACVAWCLVDTEGRVLFHEQFFGAGTVKLVGTPGALKRKINKAIVHRIARRVGILRSSPAETAFSDRQDPRTFDNFGTVLEKLPSLRVFEAKGLENIEMGSHYWKHTYRLSGEQAGWNWAEKTDYINWPEHVAARR